MRQYVAATNWSHEMHVLVDFDTKLVLGPASYEMRMKWENRIPGKQFLDYRIHGFNCRVFVEERNAEKSNA